MNARLSCRTGPHAGSDYRLDNETTIGRWEENDITLQVEAVSGQHARIFFDDERDCYVLEDLESDEGTKLDDAEVHEPLRLEDLHIVTIADTIDFVFVATDEEPSTESVEPGEQTQFGGMPASPSTLPEGEERSGDETRFGAAPGSLPDLSDEDATSKEEEASDADDRTRFGETPPELPDFSDGDEAEDDPTQVGGAPGSLPDVLDEDDAESHDKGPSDDREQTQFGDAPPEVPDFTDEEAADDDRTQMGRAPGAPSDLPGGDDPDGGDQSDEAEDRTQFGGTPPTPPDVSEEPEDAAADSDAQTQMGAGAPGLPKDPSSAGESPSNYEIQVVTENGPQELHPLPAQGTLTIGRSPDCDIQIEDPGVSREHAQLIVKPDEVIVKDMGSKNFTYVDGNRLSEPTSLSPGSEIQFGLQVKAVLKRSSS